MHQIGAQCKGDFILIDDAHNLPHNLVHEPLALNGALIRKISKRHFFQDIKKSFHGVPGNGPEPHQFFFKLFFTNYGH